MKGIDISHYQGNVDFTKVKADGYEFVFIKATEGNNYKDEMFETNYNKAKAAYLRVGAYHFGRFSNVADAKAEAKFFLQTVKGKVFTYPVVLDLEVDKYNLSDKTLTDAAIAFLEELENAGYFAMLYSGKYFLENELEDERLKPYALWVARYASQLGRDAGIWQYSSKGSVDGISGNVDMDIAYYNYSFISPKTAKVDTVQVQKKAVKPKPCPKSGIVNASLLNVRKGPGTNYGILGTLQKGKPVKIAKCVNGWYDIYFGTNGGWVSSQYIK